MVLTRGMIKALSLSKAGASPGDMTENLPENVTVKQESDFKVTVKQENVSDVYEYMSQNDCARTLFEQLVGMGFEEERVASSLACASWRPDIAIEMLVYDEIKKE